MSRDHFWHCYRDDAPVPGDRCAVCGATARFLYRGHNGNPCRCTTSTPSPSLASKRAPVGEEPARALEAPEASWAQ